MVPDFSHTGRFFRVYADNCTEYGCSMLAFPKFALFARIRQWRRPPAAPHVSDNLVDQVMPCGRILQGRFRVP